MAARAVPQRKRVAKAGRAEEPGMGAATRQERVRRDRRAVDDQLDLREEVVERPPRPGGDRTVARARRPSAEEGSR